MSYCIFYQVIMFDAQRSNMLLYFERSDLAFKHLLFNNWDPTHETMPYPPAMGKYALYNIDDLYEHINFVIEAVSWFLNKMHVDILFLGYSQLTT